ncbi:hypothetical protein NKH45_34350 [Mesorhizobium sp. M1156]|uniref:hypothetical protein n=1 Tax=Mesorhizobium sp. M1156 TaxID=2957064 RepID=UPI003336394E
MKIKLCAFVAITGCATRPADIKPMLVSSSVYAGKSCSQLEAELYRTSSDLAPIMAVQDRTARHDVDGVFWLGLPVGSMMDNTDIKAREAKSRAEGQHGRDQRSRRKGGCVAPL